MSFEGYIRNIHAKTGHKPADFRRLARARGLLANGVLAPEVKVGEVVKWLKQEFGLGHGHAMAVVAILKGNDCAL